MAIIYFSAFYFSAEKNLHTFGVILFFGSKLVFSAVSGTENDPSNSNYFIVPTKARCPGLICRYVACLRNNKDAHVYQWNKTHTTMY